jgi:hypothetical protein
MTKKKNKRFKARIMRLEKIAIQEEQKQLMIMVKDPKSAIKIFSKFCDCYSN